MIPQQSSSIWNDGLKLVSHCPVCDQRYNTIEARVLGEDGDTHLLHIRCKKCKNSILAMVLVNNVGVSSVGMITDLSFEDVERFCQSRQVSTDDVINTHVWLNKSDWSKTIMPKQIVKKRSAAKKQSFSVKNKKTGS